MIKSLELNPRKQLTYSIRNIVCCIVRNVFFFRFSHNHPHTHTHSHTLTHSSKETNFHTKKKQQQHSKRTTSQSLPSFCSIPKLTLASKRAKSKITFPNVWTNTCCSHPLHGQEPSEIDTPTVLKKGLTPGVVNAAFRKLKQELNIEAKDLPSKKEFKFLTRLHYWAADVVTHGPDSPWGEHEIDYILFARVDSSDIPSLKPNPDEVDDVRWVTKDELVKMMKPESGLLWSPWFRILTNRFLLPKRWKDLDVTMNTDTHVDVDTGTVLIHEGTHEWTGGRRSRGLICWYRTRSNDLLSYISLIIIRPLNNYNK